MWRGNPQPGAKRSRAAPKRLTANRLGGPSTIPYSHTGAAKRQRADEAASSDDASSEAPKFEDDSGDESANVSDSDDEDSGDDYVEGASDDEGVSDTTTTRSESASDHSPLGCCVGWVWLWAGWFVWWEGRMRQQSLAELLGTREPDVCAPEGLEVYDLFCGAGGFSCGGRIGRMSGGVCV